MQLVVGVVVGIGLVTLAVDIAAAGWELDSEGPNVRPRRPPMPPVSRHPEAAHVLSDDGSSLDSQRLPGTLDPFSPRFRAPT